MSITRVIPRHMKMGSYPEEVFDEKKIKPNVFALATWKWDRPVTCILYRKRDPDDGQINWAWYDTVTEEKVTPGDSDYSDDTFPCEEDAIDVATDEFLAVFYYDSDKELQELLKLSAKLFGETIEETK